MRLITHVIYMPSTIRHEKKHCRNLGNALYLPGVVPSAMNRSASRAFGTSNAPSAKTLPPLASPVSFTPFSRDLYQRFLQASREAFDVLHFDSAFYALTAAFHEANEEDSAERLAEVAQIAEEQLAWIDEHAPFSDYSTSHCLNHKTTSAYTFLMRQIQQRIQGRST